MTNAWFLGAPQSVPQNESEVRSTVNPLRENADTTEAQHTPEFNAPASDSSGELTGLNTRIVGSDVRETQKYRPHTVDAPVDYTSQIDNQVASSGTAAARESAGQAGHGTMFHQVGITPEIRDGAAFGNDYFKAESAGLQAGAGTYMQPVPEHGSNVAAGDAAERNSRAAFMASEIGKLFS